MLLKGAIMTRLALRINEELLGMAAELTGSTDGHDLFEGFPYMILTPESASEHKLVLKVEIMSEDSMVAEYRNDPELQIIS
jgi:hypothetical protein